MEIELYSVNDLQKLCRLCMGMGSEMYSVYDLTSLNEGGRHIQFVEMIMECSSLIVESGDGLPEAVCVDCLECLRNAYTFKQRCEKSDVSLRQLIDIFNGTKTELDEYDCIETLDDDEDVKENLLYIKNEDENDVRNCDLNNEDFESIPDTFDLETHIASHKVEKSEKNEDNYECRVCDYKSCDDNLVKEHLKLHGVSPFICNLCLMSYSTNRKYRLHLKSHYTHTVKSMYNCSACKQDVSGNDLKAHLKLHSNLLHTCTGCCKSYLTQGEFDSHQNDHVNSNLCPICGKLFARKSRLTSHMVYHDTATPYKCSVCDKSFRTKAICKKHEDIHTNEKPFICTWCGYTTKRTGDLNIHIRIHTGVKPYNCTLPGCDKTFTTSSQRNEHVRRHTGERNHICQLCNKSFLESKTLKIHMLVHSGVRPHKCDICGKYFRRKHHLVVHKAKLHGE
ncbi:zinc finger protein OZF-like [Chrysoperla carnea]|uniref:zinc finger protein OZF-like n=1 Tax=Chrysoperla carnea TaxID=189513 RepID=UPI001D073BB2|nr:zinc finger protein OZF-like [Chrysoperla carnea]